MQYEKLVALAFAVTLFALDGRCETTHVQDLHLSSLSDCALQRRWIGVWQQHAYGVMLRCGEHSFFVVSPDNLLGHVRIETPDQALEYVRFFSSADNYMLYDLKGMVEVLPTNKPSDSFNMVPETVFSRWKLAPATARLIRDEPCSADLELVCGKEFLITRTVVFPDEKVYKITESVRERGLYSVVSKTLLMKDAGKMGLIYIGDI